MTGMTTPLILGARAEAEEITTPMTILITIDMANNNSGTPAEVATTTTATPISMMTEEVLHQSLTPASNHSLHNKTDLNLDVYQDKLMVGTLGRTVTVGG